MLGKPATILAKLVEVNLDLVSWSDPFKEIDPAKVWRPGQKVVLTLSLRRQAAAAGWASRGVPPCPTRHQQLPAKPYPTPSQPASGRQAWFGGQPASRPWVHQRRMRIELANAVNYAPMKFGPSEPWLAVRACCSMLQ